LREKNDYAAIPTARAIEALTLTHHSGDSEVDTNVVVAPLSRQRLKTSAPLNEMRSKM
jgi:hypothetical protein